MSKVIVALGSFIVGACSMFLLISSGIQTSTFAQGRGIVAGEEPKVPPLGGELKRLSVSRSEVPISLDGMNCSDCAFSDVILQYGGGAYKFTNLSFSGPIRVQFRGAAANTMVFLELLKALGAGHQPKPPKPGTPLQRTTTPKQAVTISLNSPYFDK